MTQQRSELVKWCSITVIIILALILQSLLNTNWDAIYILNSANKLIHGGTYVGDFLDNNPPMIYFLSIIPVLIAKILHISANASLYLLIFLLALGSLILCNSLIKKIIAPTDYLYQVLLLINLSYAYLIVPVDFISEREHIMIMMTFPYFLLIALRTQGKIVANYLLITIGVLAGIGFSIKPYFLCAPALVELYLIFYTKNFLAWVRTESLIIALILIVYLASIFIITPDYIKQVLPLVYHFYLISSLSPWPALLSNTMGVLLGTAIIAYLLLRKSINYPYLIDILLLCSLGFFGSYILQQRLNFYHAIPAISTSLTLLTAFIIFSASKIYDRQQQFSIYYFSIFMMMSGIFFSYMYGTITDFYYSSSAKMTPTMPSNQLAHYVKQYGTGKPIYFFTTTVAPNVLVSDITHVTNASRLPSFWFLPGMMIVEHTATANSEQRKFLQASQHFLRQIVIEDFIKFQPELVFVDVHKAKIYLKWPLDYIEYFSQEPKFKAIWQHYHKIGSVRKYDVYKLEN